MWTTKEWNGCLERTAEYEKRECKRSQGRRFSGASSRKTDSDAENSGLEQWLKRRFNIETSTRIIWFLNNHD